MSSKNSIKIFVTSCSNYIISGLFSTLTSVLAAYFMGDIHMSTGLLGIFFSLGGVMTAVIASLPGRIVDKIGAKKTLIGITIGELLAFAIFPLANAVWVLFLAMCINCFVTSFSVPCNTQVLRALGVKDPAKLLRVNMIGTSVAGMFASFLAARLIDQYGLSWRSAFYVFFGIAAVIGLIGILVILSVKIDFTGISVAKKKDASVEAVAKSYKYTAPERTSCIALSLIYIGYMGVGITISTWLPALLAGKGFTGVEASWPTTVGTFVQLLAYLLLPTIVSKALKKTQYTPAVCAVLAVVVLGTMAVDSIIIVCIARGLLAVCMSFLSLHVQSDMALVAPAQASGRYSSTVLASANAGGVLAVILTGYLNSTGVIILLLGFVVVGVVGATMFIKPAKEIEEERKALAQAQTQNA